jgi:4-hydroxy-2-oxovalerate aldolase
MYGERRHDAMLMDSSASQGALRMAARTPVSILDTTLRDGSYIARFQFSAASTERTVRALDDAGITQIEVGHGIGIGASTRISQAAASDEAYVEAARRGARHARIAAFCQPSLAEPDEIQRCLDAGLDILRVGTDVTAHRDMAPLLAQARRSGITAFANLMKSYAVPPDALPRIARECESFGAEAVFVVDSAGCLLPAEVTAYLQAARVGTNLPLGFHGHNNLSMAAANAIAAADAGAAIIDTTLAGIGRSGGNAATELMVALLERLGYDCGDVDAARLMVLADEFCMPLRQDSEAGSAVTFALGLARVHSSHLDRIAAAAQAANVSVFRLISEVGRISQTAVDEDVLRQAVQAARKRSAPHEPGA